MGPREHQFGKDDGECQTPDFFPVRRDFQIKRSGMGETVVSGGNRRKSADWDDAGADRQREREQERAAAREGTRGDGYRFGRCVPFSPLFRV